jgi:hypothetical protein
MAEKAITFDEAPITDEVALAKEHTKLVKELKESLVFGQLGLLRAGKALYEIRKKETYKAADSSVDYKFNDFLREPDIPLPGTTDSSRVRVAQKLIRVFENFMQDGSIEEKRLAGIGYTKLDLVARALDADSNRDREEWLQKAESLTAQDLFIEAKGDKDTIADANSCDHNVIKVKYWKCTGGCGSKWDEDPNK